MNAGNVLTGLGRPAEAVASCERALALAPGYGEASNNLGAGIRGRDVIHHCHFL